MKPAPNEHLKISANTALISTNKYRPEKKTKHYHGLLISELGDEPIRRLVK